VNQPLFASDFNSKPPHIEHILLKQLPQKVPGSKELKKKAIERQTQIVAEICQNRTADKDRFFRGFSVAQIKKCKTNKSLAITRGICTRNRRSKKYSENFHEFLQCSTEICFRTATSPNLTSLKLEVSLGSTTK
jgi:ribosomal protein L13E